MAEQILYTVGNKKTSEGDSYQGAQWYIEYTTELESPGKTKVNWKLFKRGREETPTQLSTTIKLYFTSDYTITAIDGSVLTWTPSRFSTEPDKNGTNHPHCSYRGSLNTTPTKTGSFVITHDQNGSGSFKVQLKAAIYTKTVTDGQIYTIDLGTNLPYTSCYWDTNAKVSIDKSIQKPGGTITVSWSGAKAGTANPIAGFNVQLLCGLKRLNTTEGKDSTSATFKLPETSSSDPWERGSIITAKVIIKNTWTGASAASKEGGACTINRLPNSPTVSSITGTVPSTQQNISFNVTAGTDGDSGQTTSVYYATAQAGTKTKYTSGSNLPINAGTNNFYFWTYDGLEFSEKCETRSVKKNSTPTVTFALTGDSFNKTITATPAGGSTSNKYTYGFTYNNKDYTMSQDNSSATYYYGDIRKFLSDVLNGLTQDNTYQCFYWVKRHDGVEECKSVLLDGGAFKIPKLVINTEDSYFSKTYPDSTNASYYYNPSKGARDVASYTANMQGQKLTHLPYRRDVNSSQWFNIKLTTEQQKTKIYDFSFQGLSFPSSFKPYSTSTLTFNMQACNQGYGFNNAPSITVGGKTIDGQTSLTDNQWDYALTPDQLWNTGGLASAVANDSTAETTLTIVVTNKYGDRFTRNQKIIFDFRETPIISDFDMTGYVANNDWRSLSSVFKYVKEGVKTKMAGKISYYSKQVNVVVTNTAAKMESRNFSISQTSFYITPWEKIATGGWKKTPRTYELSSHNESVIAKTTVDYTTRYQIVVSSGNNTATATTNDVKFKRHTEPRIQFVELKYSGTTLAGAYKIIDLGYDPSGTNGSITSITLDSSSGGNNIKNGTAANTVYAFSIENYAFGDAIFRSIAPVCSSSLSAKYIDNGQEKYTAGTNYPTSQLEYFIVYNILPTVAYRQNQLGINTNDPSNGGKLSDSALTISAYNTKNKIYLSYADKVAYIDLTTGKQDGFIIDCGTWT